LQFKIVLWSNFLDKSHSPAKNYGQHALTSYAMLKMVMMLRCSRMSKT